MPGPAVRVHELELSHQKPALELGQVSSDGGVVAVLFLKTISFRHSRATKKRKTFRHSRATKKKETFMKLRHRAVNLRSPDKARLNAIWCPSVFRIYKKTQKFILTVDRPFCSQPRRSNSVTKTTLLCLSLMDQLFLS